MGMTKQEKRENIIRALENCNAPEKCRDCSWDECEKPDCKHSAYPDGLIAHALALLKAQEPRVITWRDVIGAAIECKPLFIEVKDYEYKEPGDDRWAMVTQYKDSITNGMIRAMSSYVTSEILFADDYGKTWRCWTSAPTDEQREATPWEG